MKISNRPAIWDFLGSVRFIPGKLIFSIHFWIVLALCSAILGLYYTWQSWFPFFWYYFAFVEYVNGMIGLLIFAIPFLYAVIVFRWRGAVGVSLVSFPALVPLIFYYYETTGNVVRNIAFLLLPSAIIVLIAMEINWHRKEREIATEREKERQLYMTQVLQAQEEERKRIALEIHDDAIQRLVVHSNYAENMLLQLESKNSSTLKKDIKWIRDNSIALTEDLRRMSLDLRPSILDNFGLVPALRWLVGRMNKETDINAKVKIKGTVQKLLSDIEVNIFRIVQEALNNAIKHSRCREVLVTLEYGSDGLELTVEDDGQGFSIENTFLELASERKMGLIGMKQRARSINGIIEISSQLRHGTQIKLKLPSSDVLG
ncbi:MAG: sensor histidine kinase [Dehalococcoidales bacterium]|nr:sensor histidine kinase [Dehalococcoidales bacterium]